MANHRKRRRLGNPDPPEDSEAERLIKTFARVEPLLCDLLAVSRAVADIGAVVGEQRARFIVTLRSLIWVNEEIPSGTSLERTVTEKSATSLGKRPAPVERGPEPAASLFNQMVSQRTWPPPLPPIEDARIRQDALFLGPKHNFQRMEFLGDAYLQMVSTHLLYDRFPTSREGPLSDMRAKLVANIPLFEYARLYNFSSMMSGAPSWKMLADAFEAYVAGIILSDPVGGIEKLTEWLTALYEPKMQEMARDPKAAKPRFAVKLGIRKLKFKKNSASRTLRERSTTRGELHPHLAWAPGPEAGPEEDGWEEWGDAMMIDGPNPQDAVTSPIDKNAKTTLHSLISGDGATVKYVSLEDGGSGFEVMAVFTGWGFVDQPVGQGWGANEE